MVVVILIIDLIYLFRDHRLGRWLRSPEYPDAATRSYQAAAGWARR